MQFYLGVILNAHINVSVQMEQITVDLQRGVLVLSVLYTKEPNGPDDVLLGMGKRTQEIPISLRQDIARLVTDFVGGADRVILPLFLGKEASEVRVPPRDVERDPIASSPAAREMETEQAQAHEKRLRDEEGGIAT